VARGLGWARACKRKHTEGAQQSLENQANAGALGCHFDTSVTRCLVFVCVCVRVAHFSLAMVSARSASVRFGSFRDSLQPSSSMSIKANMAMSAVTPLSTGGADKEQPVS